MGNGRRGCDGRRTAGICAIFTKTLRKVTKYRKSLDKWRRMCYNNSNDGGNRRKNRKEDEKMKEFKNLKKIFAEINGLAEKADQFTAQRCARAADPVKAKEIWEEYTEQANRDHENKTRAKVLCLNAAYYITTELLPAAAEIWNGYEGKKIGEKTREKIRAQARALADAAGVQSVVFYNDHIAVRFCYASKIYYDFDGKPDGRGGAYFGIDYWHDGNGERLNLYDESGRAARINLDGVKKYGDFIADIDKFIKKANEARKLIEQKKQELKDAQHAAAIYSDIFDPWNI